MTTEHEERGRDRPRCKERSFLYPNLQMQQMQKLHCSPDKAPPNNHTPDLAVFSISDQPIPFRTPLPGPGDTEEKRREKASHHIGTPWHDFHHLGNQQAGVLIASCPRLDMQLSWRLLQRSRASLQQDTRPGTEYSYTHRFCSSPNSTSMIYTFTGTN